MTETQLGGNAASAITPGRLVLLRHGQTVWSESGQHTGRTNIPLTDIGCDQARAAGERLREAFPQGFAQGCMFASPLRRAQQTAQLAGYGDFDVLPEIAEWDYGRAEGSYAPGNECGGRFRLGMCGATVRRHFPESLEGDWIETLPNGEQVPVHNGPGETVEEAAARTREAIATVKPLLDAGNDVLLVAHAHVLRILTSQWLGVDPHFARLLRLDTAHYCVLSQYKGDNVIEHWNC